MTDTHVQMHPQASREIRGKKRCHTNTSKIDGCWIGQINWEECTRTREVQSPSSVALGKPWSCCPASWMWVCGRTQLGKVTRRRLQQFLLLVMILGCLFIWVVCQVPPVIRAFVLAQRSLLVYCHHHKYLRWSIHKEKRVYLCLGSFVSQHITEGSRTIHRLSVQRLKGRSGGPTHCPFWRHSLSLTTSVELPVHTGHPRT